MNNDHQPKAMLLIQYNEQLTSRTFIKFDNRSSALNYLFEAYEDFLKERKNSNGPCIAIVEMTDLLKFIFNFYDFAYLEYDDIKEAYIPFGKDWFSQLMISTLKKNIL